MRLVRTCFLVVGLVFVGAFARAQSTTPVINQPIGAQSLVNSGYASSFDLRTAFFLPGVTGQVAQFDTVLGKFNVELFNTDTPLTVANFLGYIERGGYTNTLVHRSVPGFVFQGGGYQLVGTTLPTVPAAAPVQNEFRRSNLRGTLAMAKLATGPNTATSEWFVNLGNNSANLDNQNGGFTVFARVLGSGMSVVDAIAAVPAYNVSNQLGSAFTDLPLLNPALTPENLVLVRSISVLPIYPDGAAPASVLTFTATSSNESVVAATVSGSSLALTPRSAGSATVTVKATDTNNNSVEMTVPVSVSAGSTFAVQPASQSVAAGSTVTLVANAVGATSYQWQRNGANIDGATGATHIISNIQPQHAGVYVALATGGNVTTPSQPAVIGVTGNTKVVGNGTEVGFDIQHPNGNVYDQVLLNGAAATIRADAGQVVRLSYLDMNDDIVQVEFGGAGSLTINLDGASGPAAPVKYNQDVSYMKGHASIVIAGADATTNVSVFSVGRATAVNQALFRDGVSYDGMADIASIAIASTNGSFGGIRTANTSYNAPRGFTGVYAPGVQFTGPLFVGDVSAFDSATPVLRLAGSSDARITGGDIFQSNARFIQIDGLTRLQMSAGTDSHGNQQVAQTARGRLDRNGADVTAEVVQNPN